MKAIRDRFTFSNVIALTAMFIALGGTAYAIDKNSVGTAQLKNKAVTAKKLKNNAVTAKKIKNGAVSANKLKGDSVATAKIRNGAVTAEKLADGSVGGAKLNLSSIGTVPKAASLEGQESFFLKMEGGETKKIASHGVVSLVAKCTANEVGNDYIEIFAETTQNGAILAADDDLEGGSSPDDFLNVDTPSYRRDFEYESTSTGETYVAHDIDSGFVLGPDGKAILANSEGMILGLNYLGSRCIAAGVINKIG